MDCWAFIKHKSWLYWPLMVHLLMVGQTQGDCIEEEKMALLEIKASHMKSFDSKNDHFLPTWVDYGGSTPGDGGGNCCDWERVTCNTTTGHVTDLTLYRLRDFTIKLWPLNVSLFLHFRELRSLNLSYNYLDMKIIKTGFGRLSNLKKLEVLDLSFNYDIDNDILPSLRNLTSLKILDLSDTSLSGNFSADEFAALENLEMLDLSHCNFNGTFNIQGFERVSILRKLKTLNLGSNSFNRSVLTSLSTLSSLTNLNLNGNQLSGPFPAEELLNLPDLEVLLLRGNYFNGTLPIEALTSFHHLRVLDLSYSNFYGGIPSAIRTLSSLRSVSFAHNYLNGSLSNHGLCELKNLRELDLSYNMLDGNLPHCLNNLSSLKLLDISSNRFTGMLVSSLIANLTSLEYIDLSHNTFEGSFLFSSFSNHTKLEFIRFISDNDRFEVETEEPIGWIPMFQLQILELSNCNMKMPKGLVIPGFLLHQHKLQQVDMSHNSMEGHFPNWLIKNNTNLELLILRNNMFSGISLYRNNNMKWLDMSGNRIIGNIPDNIPKFFPNIYILNFSMNSLSGVIPSSIGDLSGLGGLDLSDNELSGEVPKGLFTNISQLFVLKLSENKLHGQVLSGNLTWCPNLSLVYLDSNYFTGKIGTKSMETLKRLTVLDISNNLFTGTIPGWISNMSGLSQLVVRNNSFEGRFPCGTTSFSFLDISQNSFSGPLPSCLNLQDMEHLHLGSNRFTRSIPNYFRNLTQVLTFDIGNNNLSGRIPEFLGELSTLRILILRKNKFSGSIPKNLCLLRNVSLLDLSYNSLSGSIPGCLQNITGPSYLAFLKKGFLGYAIGSSYHYPDEGIKWWQDSDNLGDETSGTQEQVEFTTKKLFLQYKGDILNYMAGLDLSCNKLLGEIPEELGLLTQLRGLNLSHNQLSGPIPMNFSNLVKIESLDLSSNGLTGTVPTELIELTYLSVFNVSHNNLSGKLPEMKAQFSTFTKASYEGNPFLCGQPLEKKCLTANSPVKTNKSAQENNEKRYDIDMTCFYASSCSTCVLLLLGFIGLLYISPQWRRRWVEWVED